ncbi:MAG: HAMP domain-containing sensor histidine kinase [Balneolaceae bacterium]|nr:HAMP domain-containing sensor histidine kinase [Balneolaceae bacterium]MDR9410635.1 HAMP domain-containing sensor histidine kinase [Balneolaceae bacterium]
MKSIFNKYKQSNTLRWFFLGVGILAVIALTGLNVYSLYALRESTIDSAKENRKVQLEEFTEAIRHRFYSPFRGISKLDMSDLQESWNENGDFPPYFREVLANTISDSLFTDVYYTPDDRIGCWHPDRDVYRFDQLTSSFVVDNNFPKEACDGIGISKTRMNTVSLDDYRWNLRTEFDAHRSMTLALINNSEKEIIGHLNFLIDKEYLLNNIMKPKLEAKIGSPEESGIVVWLRDWMQNDILLCSGGDITYDRAKVDLRQRFPDLLDNWVLYASFTESPSVAATKASVNRNFVLLGIAVFILFGAFIFMFINAQREREFARRQAGFLANVTHELKTPLAVMQAAGENISDGRVTDGKRLKDYGAHIYNEAIRLRKMIDKLLDVAKVDSGQTVVEQAPYQLKNLVLEYYQTNKSYIEQKGFIFEFQSDEKVPLVMIDPDHLETIMNNLVENSLKYSHDKKNIQIELRSESDSVKLSVADYGEGIPKKVQKNIFDKFYRVENSLTAKTKGHGLGLSIVKNLVSLNGGSISVKSEHGKGATFTLTFKALVEAPKDYDRQESDDAINIPKSVELDNYVG